MINLQKDVIQPLGEHNPPTLCVKAASLKENGYMLEYPFEYFNPPQSEICETLGKHNNLVVTSPTASGKTIMSEIRIAETLGEGYKTLVLTPLKALTEERILDWTNVQHTFSRKKVIPITGDYALTPKKREQLLSADIIVATSEMLDSKTRNYANNEWLHDIKLLIVDEAHLIGSRSRGPRLESAVMRFAKLNPECRIVLMSATVPNKEDLVKWLENLTDHTTQLITSNYRPCKLNKTFVSFDDTFVSGRDKYNKIEQLRMEACYKLIMQNKNDQHIVFTGPKNWGYQFKDYLKQYGINAEFHNADLAKEKRAKIENDFRTGKVHILISTSTLAWGVNLPARRVILAHTKYGLEPMEICDIEQSCGRSGRPKYDKVGDAYILIPKSEYDAEIQRIKSGFRVESNIYSIDNLAFHAVSEISMGNIRTVHDFFEWYKDTLAYVQNVNIKESDCLKVFKLLEEKKMIKNEAESGEEPRYITTRLGDITSSMYMNPLDVYDWFFNFLQVPNLSVSLNSTFKEAQEINKQIALALATCYEYRRNRPFCSRAEANCLTATKFASLSPGDFNGVKKIASCYYAMLNGEAVSSQLLSTTEGLRVDLKRVLATLKQVHGRYAGFIAQNNPKDVKGYHFSTHEWDKLYFRIMYGVPVEKIELVSIPGVGRAYCDRLYENGIKTRKDFFSNIDKVKKLLGEKRCNSILNRLQEEENA